MLEIVRADDSEVRDTLEIVCRQVTRVLICLVGSISSRLIQGLQMSTVD